jgi:aryl-alcohol dehydrogenase-like predicted oxidoreductase
MKNQLDASLERLNLSTLDCYLIHNPEYFLYESIKKGVSKEEMLDEMYERIFEAFVGLEEEVKNGRIKGYGISSNSFSLPSNHKAFLPYEDLVTLAQKASLKANNKKHSFTTIELPINLLEKEGLKATFWAKENGLRVLSNRALNAVLNGKTYRLAEYDESRDYYMYLNELLEFCDNELLESLYNLILSLDENKHRFEFIGDFDSFLHLEVLPHIQKVIVDLDDSSKEKLVAYLELFLIELKEMIAYENSKKTKEELKIYFQSCNKRMQDCALEYLLKQDSIDYVIVGARRVKYIHEILALKEFLDK